MRRFAIGGALALALSACSTVVNEDAAPGDTLGVISPVGWFQPTGPASTSWQRVRLIAPAGATECGVLPFNGGGGPDGEAAPNANREVDVTVRANRRTARFYCDTENGRIVRRMPAAIVFRHELMGETYRFPPMVHIAGPDAQSEERWRIWQAEACSATPQPSYVCEPDNIPVLRALDLNAADP